MVRLLQRFDRLENMEDPSLPMKLKFNLSIKSGIGVQVRFHKAPTYSEERPISYLFSLLCLEKHSFIAFSIIKQGFSMFRRDAVTLS